MPTHPRFLLMMHLFTPLTLVVLFLFNFCLPQVSHAANEKDLLKLIELKNAQAAHLDLSHADLRNYPFVPGKIDLQQANLSHSNLAGVDLSRMNLQGADLSYTDLSHAKLKQVNLADANLEHANLSAAQFQQSDFSRANLSFTLLIGANLQEAILSHANLTCSNLNQADLTKSTFADADISGATFINTLTTDIIGYDSVIDKQINCQ